MFGEQAFQSWPLVIAGALLFSAMFTLLALMAELLFEGAFRVTGEVKAFAVASFVGYVGIAFLLRRGHVSSDEPHTPSGGA